MSVVVQEQFTAADPLTFSVGPKSSASPWRILSIFVCGEGTVEINTGADPHFFTVVKDTFKDELVLPSAAIPFPITMGNAKATCAITAPANCFVRIVYEDGIG